MMRKNQKKMSSFVEGAIKGLQASISVEFLLYCPRFSTQHRTLLGLVSTLAEINIMRFSSKELRTLLLYGNSDFSFLVNRGVTEETIKYVKNTKRLK